MTIIFVEDYNPPLSSYLFGKAPCIRNGRDVGTNLTGGRYLSSRPAVHPLGDSNERLDNRSKAER